MVIKATLTGFDDAENIQYFGFGRKEKQIGETISHIFRKKEGITIRCEPIGAKTKKYVLTGT